MGNMGMHHTLSFFCSVRLLSPLRWPLTPKKSGLRRRPEGGERRESREGIKVRSRACRAEISAMRNADGRKEGRTVTSFFLSLSLCPSHFPSHSFYREEVSLPGFLPWELTRREKVLTSDVKQSQEREGGRERSLFERDRERARGKCQDTTWESFRIRRRE